jgi:putative hydrolase of the HAD superfamily
VVDRRQLRQMLDLFDVVVELGRRVPQAGARFYDITLERLGVEAARAVLLDDLGINLKPAREMGMTTIKVVDPVEAISELERVVGFPLR